VALWLPEACCVYNGVSFLQNSLLHRSANLSDRTCFWGGDAFAPKLKIKTPQGEVPVQQYLQDDFLNMYEVVVRAIGDLDGVLGFEVCLNNQLARVCLPDTFDRS
jgi:hypothetical protein